MISVGKGTIIKPTAIIEEGCTIGDNCFIADYVVMRSGCRIGNNTKIGQHCLFEQNVIVGNDVSIMNTCGFTRGLIIEDKAFLGSFVTTANDRFMVHQRRHIKPFVEEPPIIRRAARIGCMVMILPRIEVGENSVVGAGAVVTKNVAPRTVVFGNPARFVMLVPTEEII